MRSRTTRSRRLRRPTALGLGILLALIAAALRGPCREALRRAGQDASPPRTARIARVVDGDTVVADGGLRIRLIGLDAPDGDAPFAREARTALERLVAVRTVRLGYELEREDRHGRTLAHLYVEDGAGEVLVAEELLRAGLAAIYLIPPNLALADRLARAQREAVEASRGLWGLETAPEPYYIEGAYKFHRPDCPHARAIPRPRRTSSRRDLLVRGKAPCRTCRP